jgi:hypothetical protein
MSSYLKGDFFEDSLPFITYKIILLLILVSVRLLKVTRREVPFSIICGRDYRQAGNAQTEMWGFEHTCFGCSNTDACLRLNVDKVGSVRELQLEGRC